MTNPNVPKDDDDLQEMMMTCRKTLCSAPPCGVILPATVFYAPLLCGRLHVLCTYFTSASGV